MPAPKRTEKAQEWKDLYDGLNRRALNECNDCSVVSLAAVTGVDYEKAHRALETQGRKPRRGARTSQSLLAMEKLGFTHRKVNPRTFIDQYPKAHRILKSVTTHHPDRFPKVWKDGKRYLLVCDRHILAVVDGVNVDWTRGRAMRVLSIYEVIEKC